ncbi:DUF397 domain-containing protein [Thermopolyspora sp. NPDC052614]|uniref:DUF397 domain-containing protein n=1 Tax=Thermopolyspora sp. NPDC052614 TaxID=3155682 RepID=UPI003423D64E
MSATHVNRREPAWRKATASGGGNCVEVAPFHGSIAMRDSKNPEGAILVIDPNAWASFVTAIKREG